MFKRNEAASIRFIDHIWIHDFVDFNLAARNFVKQGLLSFTVYNKTFHLLLLSIYFLVYNDMANKSIQNLIGTAIYLLNVVVRGNCLHIFLFWKIYHLLLCLSQTK